jgi:hypothetical protein
MDNLTIKESDLASFAGLITIVPILVGTLKNFIKWIAGKEAIASLVLTYTIGISAKATIPGAFGGVGWLTLLVSLVVISGVAAHAHDYLSTKVFNKSTTGPPDAGSPKGDGGGT